MDAVSSTIRSFFQEPLDATLLQGLSTFCNKGDVGALCQVLRYGLSAAKLRAFTAYLKRQGYVLTLTSETKFLETVIRIAQTELGYSTKLGIDDLVMAGNLERKKMFVLDVLTMSAKKNEELEKAESMFNLSPASPFQSRRRSYSAGAEQLRVANGAIPMKSAAGGETRGLKPARPVTNGPTSTETWVSSPPPQPPFRAGYYSRVPSLTTPPSVLHPAHAPTLSQGREEDGPHNANNPRGPLTPLSPGFSQSPRLTSTFVQRVPQSTAGSDDDTNPGGHQHQAPLSINTIVRNGSEQSLNALSPRDRMLSPQRKSPNAVHGYSAVVSLKTGRRRLDLEEESAGTASLVKLPTQLSEPEIKKNGSLNGGEALIAERLNQLECRIETELAAMNERFARLESTLNDLARVILNQNKGENALHGSNEK